jgi:hypothetical protein
MGAQVVLMEAMLVEVQRLEAMGVRRHRLVAAAVVVVVALA